MSNGNRAYAGGPIFDGETLWEDHAALFKHGVFETLSPLSELASSTETVDLRGDILSPGFVDLQINGGGGVMFNDDPSPATLSQIAKAHRRLGTVWFLPTLITDTADKTCAAIQATETAIAQGVPGVAGLHLEGPHISVARKGAHDPANIRPMDDDDLSVLLTAAQNLPVLKVTLAPENATLDQVKKLSNAGVVVSLGHTDAGFDTCCAYAQAGARCVTHLFNAMSQLGSREPGLVGAALKCGQLSAGMIADGIHVHSATIRAAWNAKIGPGKIFLVTDAMAPSGTEIDSFQLDGRVIHRRNGRLTLEDGTLAGADLDMTTALRTFRTATDASMAASLAAATSGPAELIGLQHGNMITQRPSEHGFIRVRPDLSEAAPLLPD